MRSSSSSATPWAASSANSRRRAESAPPPLATNDDSACEEALLGFGEERVVVDARQVELALLDLGPKPGSVCGWMRWLTNSPRARAISSASSDLGPQQGPISPARRHALHHLGEQARRAAADASAAANSATSSGSPGIGSAMTMPVLRICGRSVGVDAGVAPGALRPQPDRQRGDLGGPGVDVDAVQVALDDQRRDARARDRRASGRCRAATGPSLLIGRGRAPTPRGTSRRAGRSSRGGSGRSRRRGRGSGSRADP